MSDHHPTTDDVLAISESVEKATRHWLDDEPEQAFDHLLDAKRTLDGLEGLDDEQ